METQLPTSTSSCDSIEEANPSRRAVRNLLKAQTELKCTLDDGRIVIGGLVCIDRLKNIILCNVMEERFVDSSMYETAKEPRQIISVKRKLSQAMIPGPNLVKVEVARSVYDVAIEPIIGSAQKS